MCCIADLGASKGYTDSRAEAALIGRKGGTGPDGGLLHGVCVEVHGFYRGWDVGLFGEVDMSGAWDWGYTCFVQLVVTFRGEGQGN
jgi:hypothetical protein